MFPGQEDTCPGTWGLGQPCLLPKHEDPSLIPKAYLRIWVQPHMYCISSSGEEKMGRSLGPAELVSSRVRERLCLKT